MLLLFRELKDLVLGFLEGLVIDMVGILGIRWFFVRVLVVVDGLKVLLLEEKMVLLFFVFGWVFWNWLKFVLFLFFDMVGILGIKCFLFEDVNLLGLLGYILLVEKLFLELLGLELMLILSFFIKWLDWELLFLLFCILKLLNFCLFWLLGKFVVEKFFCLLLLRFRLMLVSIFFLFELDVLLNKVVKEFLLLVVFEDLLSVMFMFGIKWFDCLDGLDVNMILGVLEVGFLEGEVVVFLLFLVVVLNDELLIEDLGDMLVFGIFFNVLWVRLSEIRIFWVLIELVVRIVWCVVFDGFLGLVLIVVGDVLIVGELGWLEIFLIVVCIIFLECMSILFISKRVIIYIVVIFVVILKG